MLRFRSALCALFLLLGFALTGAAPAPATPPAPDANRLSYVDALILGLVEGVTEYLPISSTGHLILAEHAMGLDKNQPLLDHAGQPISIMRKGETTTLTLKDAMDSYAVIIQGGAILAVLFLYWTRVWSLVRGVLGKDRAGLLLLRNLLLAFIPAAVLGLLLEHWIEKNLFSPMAVVIALAVGAVVMLAVEKWRKARSPKMTADAGPDLHELSVRQSLFIGCCQCFSLWPGTSRSMTAIVGGYFAGLRPARAAEFSFLLGLITLSAASGWKTLRRGHEILAAIDPGPLLFGIIVATISAFFAVKWLVAWLNRHGLALFAWYRLILAALVLLMLG